jgi:hypothetical protein
MSVDREYRIRISTVTDGDPGKVADGLKEVGKESEKAMLTHREWHKLLHTFAHVAGPEAGLALSGVATAAIGGFGIALLTVKQLIEFVKKLREESAETQKKISEMATETRDAIEESSKTWNEFIERMHAAKDPADQLEASYKRQKEDLTNISEAHKQILDAMEKEEIAAAKGDKSKEDEIKARYDQARAVTEDSSGAAQIAAHQKYIDTLKKRQPDLDQAAATAAGDLSFLKGNKPVPAGFKIDEDVENNLRTAQRKAQGAANRAETDDLTLWERIVGKSVQERREELAAANRSLAEYEKNRDALTHYNDQLTKEGDILKANEAARDKNKNTITTETNALNLEVDKRAGKGSGDAVQKAIELSQRAAAGGKLNATEGQFVQQIGSLVSGQNVNLANAEQLFLQAAKNPAQLNRILTRIANLLDGQNQALQNWISRQEQKMSEMQARIDRPRT